MTINNRKPDDPDKLLKRTTQKRRDDIRVYLINIERVLKDRNVIPKDAIVRLEQRIGWGTCVECVQPTAKSYIDLGNIFSRRRFDPPELELYLLGYYDALCNVEDNKVESF